MNFLLWHRKPSTLTVRPAKRVPPTRKRVPLGSSAYCKSTPAGPSVARLARTAFSTPRYKNLCIVRAVGVPTSWQNSYEG